ncbi:tRNA (32-2'-O)-methyltransferase regulator THADA isoform X1 [Mirounga angustirostris]|uniref:tRNA (32-2'-O)-methyltransferase regulator THADA isoform X1 n=2 Tax=Mirounga angustirostris TaxID=9716 RepID=UPI001E686F40|nr:thyroid adenoma-associated protein isoform X1 [Mirounga angustirostris]XP_054365871.1 thyroid adenoma-associated protein isoform X1 [Mirounga angustirostris]
MGVKKKKEMQVTAMTICHQDLETLRSLADVEGKNLASLLLHCVQLTDGVSQIHYVKQIVPLLEKADKNGACDPTIRSCLDILAGIYLSLTVKNPLKKVLASSLNGLPEFFLTEAIQSFTSRLQEELNTTDLCSYRKVTDNISSCMENFDLGRAGVNNLLKNVLHFLQKSLIEISEENRKFAGNHIVQTQLMNDLLVGTRVSVMLVQKIQDFQRIHLKTSGSPTWQSMCGLLSIFTKFLSDDDLLQTIQSTSGLAVILFIKAMFHPPEKIPDLISSLLLRSVDCTSIPDWFLNCCRSLCCTDVSQSTLLFLCQGTLTMLDWQNGSMGLSGEALLLNIVHVLFTLSSQIKESTLELFLSRILASWTNSAIHVLESSSPSLKDSLNGNSSVVGRLLEYVYTHWEHPLDALRHQTKIIFRNILQMHQLTKEKSDSETSGLAADRFICDLTESLLQLEWHVKGKYACLGCLVDYVGIGHILALAKTIPSQILEVMGDQSLVPYASDLLETMFRNHKSHLKSQAVDSTWIDEWHETWVSPLLFILCEGNLDQKSYVIDYYLPKLLNCSPESLSYMVKILQTSADAKTGSHNSRGALGALMACLRTARAHGHLQSATDAWRNLVSSARIKQGLIHQHCQVRIDTLGLLCESNRSTEIVSMEEMQWIQFFITYNLNSQSPGVRQQICSLLKKLFCRIQESSQVLYKLEQSRSKHESENELTKQHPSVSLQQYKNFMSSICNRLFEALFPGSSYPTRFSALTILGSVAEVFPVPEGQVQTVYQLSHDIDVGRFQTLMECFTSTFEEVKILAFDLLMKLPKTVVQFQDSEKLQALFQAALELSSSTKPYDCVTASYLLNFLIWQDALPSSLSASLQTQQASCGNGDKSAVVVERNTLMVIKCLLENLEEELSQAENSLLQAAASFPLYGRVHCITGALQRLSLNSLRLVSEWRPVVEKLLLMSYRLSAVVSPVIQSSSPEGLIPMDTDSESASRLQTILSEIQPRDTNDYFTQAKILKERDSFDLEDLNASVPNIGASAEIKGSKERKTCDVTAQMVLVCCWRSMKEVALLLGTLCQLLPMQSMPESSNGLLTVEQVKEIGDYFKQHLLQSRHRGAFELAYTGFVKLTEILNRCPNVSLQNLPEQWLWNVLEEIKCSDPSSKLCATRRSAGIPFYIQALLASEPKKGKMDLLKITMKELITLAGPTDDSRSTVSKVHALNILRALFRDTRLGENIIPYVADGAKAAILGFTSPVWAVRNSSTLLFSTLITRIFGVKRGKDELSKKNRMTGSEFFSRFPELYPFLLQQLEAVANTVDSDTGELNRHPSMFLLLLVLGRLYPSPMDGTSSALSMAPFIPFIMRCGRSPVYRSRVMAARALVPFVMVDEIPTTIRTLLAKLPNCTDQCFRQNHIHGTLLQVFHLLEACTDSKYRLNAYFQQLLADVAVCTRAKLWLAKRQNPCLVTRAVYIDILFLLTRCLDKPTKGTEPAVEHLGFWEDVRRIISGSELITGFPYTFTVPGLPQYLQSLTKLAIATAQAGEQAGNIPIFFSQLLESSFPEVRLLTLDALLERFSTAASGLGEKGLPPLLWNMGGTFLMLAMKENHPECFCKILKILHCMDPSEWLPQTEHCIHLTPKEFLIWTMDIASNERSEIQSVALRLASRVITHHLQTCEETRDSVAPTLKSWVQLVAFSCGEHLPTESRLAAAEALTSTTPFLLTSLHPILGLQDTLALWRCVLTLLQSEEQAVRDAATGTVVTAMSQGSTCQSTEFAFCQVDASIALPLALAVLCDLLQQWDQLAPGLPVLLGWLLGEGDDFVVCVESTHQVEDYLFEKAEVNFWAETLIFVKYLSEHLFQLLSKSSCNALSPQSLHHLHRTASEQGHLLSQLFRELPPAAEFLKTVEFTRLRIQEERTSACLRLLALLEGKEREDTPILGASDSPAEANQFTLVRKETAC